MIVSLLVRRLDHTRSRRIVSGFYKRIDRLIQGGSINWPGIRQFSQLQAGSAVNAGASGADFAAYDSFVRAACRCCEIPALFEMGRPPAGNPGALTWLLTTTEGSDGKASNALHSRTHEAGSKPAYDSAQAGHAVLFPPVAGRFVMAIRTLLILIVYLASAKPRGRPGPSACRELRRSIGRASWRTA